MAALPSSFAAESGSSDGVTPGKGVPKASSLPLIFEASEYPSGRDHHDRQPQVPGCCSAGLILGGSGGNGGSSTLGGFWAGSTGFTSFCSLTEPSEETLNIVMEAGMLSALLDLRLVRNLAGDWSLDFCSSWVGISEAAPPLTLTPMLWLAVLTVAEALDLQLPPLNHLWLGFVFSFCSVGIACVGPVGVSGVSGAFVVVSEEPFCRTVLSFGVATDGVGVVVACVLALLVSHGASDVVDRSRSAKGLGFDFLRGPIPASVVRRLCNLWRVQVISRTVLQGQDARVFTLGRLGLTADSGGGRAMTQSRGCSPAAVDPLLSLPARSSFSELLARSPAHFLPPPTAPAGCRS